MRKRELKLFGKKISKELNHIKNSKMYTERIKIEKIVTLKDIVFLLGVSIDKEKYNWATGFNKFWEELGLNG